MGVTVLMMEQEPCPAFSVAMEEVAEWVGLPAMAPVDLATHLTPCPPPSSRAVVATTSTRQPVTTLVVLVEGWEAEATRATLEEEGVALFPASTLPWDLPLLTTETGLEGHQAATISQAHTHPRSRRAIPVVVDAGWEAFYRLRSVRARRRSRRSILPSLEGTRVPRTGMQEAA